jgi:hypothetical protein
MYAALLAPALAFPAKGQEPPESAPAESPPRQPADAGAVPGLEDADFKLKPPSLLREGAFVENRRGSLAKLPSGQWAFVFHKDERGHTDKPVVLVPCQMLQRLEQAAADRSADAAFNLTGHVYAYKGVNYLEPTRYLIAGADPPAASPAEPPSPGPSPEPPQGSAEAVAGQTTGANPSVDQLIRDLEAQRDRPRALQPMPAIPTPAPTASGSIVPEGRTIIRRRGRMARTSGGEWALVFDSGSAGETEIDRPLLLVPCMNLARMETWAGRSGDAINFEVSGRILAYQGRNYLVPTLFQVVTPAELAPRQ